MEQKSSKSLITSTDTTNQAKVKIRHFKFHIISDAKLTTA